jgi:hypothetical protein
MTTSPSTPAVDPRLARTLWQWLALGAIALVAWPAARGQTQWLGWGPYWAVVAPAIALAVAYRHRLFDRSVEDAAPATTHRRRARAVRAQAQRAVGPRRGRQLRVA